MRYKDYRKKRLRASILMYLSFCTGFVLMGTECRDLWMQLIALALMASCYGVTGLCYKYIDKLERRYRYYAGRYQHRSKRYA